MKATLKEVIKDMDFLSLTIKEVEGISLVMPEILALNWPDHLKLGEFPPFCGADYGFFNENRVPENFYGLKQSHNCFIHDITHTIFQPTKKSFHISNQLLLTNCLNTIRVRSNAFMRLLRERRALKYYDSVETETGFNCFLNRKGGNFGQADYNPMEDETFIAKLKKVGVIKPWGI